MEIIVNDFLQTAFADDNGNVNAFIFGKGLNDNINALFIFFCNDILFCQI